MWGWGGVRGWVEVCEDGGDGWGGVRGWWGTRRR